MEKLQPLMAVPQFSSLLDICLADTTTDDNGRWMTHDNERRALLIMTLSRMNLSVATSTWWGMPQQRLIACHR